MRLRRNPRLSSHPLSTDSKVPFQKDDIDANARELNIFLRNVASLLDASMSMPVPTSPPTAATPLDITGDDSLTTPSPSPTAASNNTNNSTGSNPEPIKLPTQLPTLAPVQVPATDNIAAGSECVPLDDVPGSNDVAVNVAISYELVIEADADISDILSELEAFMQEYLSVAASGCGSSESRLLLSSSDLDHRRKLYLSAIDSYGISDTPRLGKVRPLLIVWSILLFFFLQ